MSKNKEEDKEEEAVWKEVFDLFDKDRNGTISVDELGTVLRALGMNPSKKEVLEASKKLDINGDGKIQFKEFLKIMGKRKKKPEDEEEEMLRAFKLMDKDGNGYVTADDLMKTMTQLGEPLSKEEVDEMIRVSDLNHDGKIDYKEFVKMMMAPCL